MTIMMIGVGDILELASLQFWIDYHTLTSRTAGII